MKKIRQHFGKSKGSSQSADSAASSVGGNVLSIDGEDPKVAELRQRLQAALAATAEQEAESERLAEQVDILESQLEDMASGKMSMKAVVDDAARRQREVEDAHA